VNFRTIFILLVILRAGDCFCASPVSITADYKHYDKYRDVLIAKGNVVVNGADFKIESPYVIRYFKDDKVIAMDKFVYEREGYRISGNSMEYNYKLGTGNAEKVRINYGETFVGARYMTIDPDNFEMYDAYFSGCNEPKSHYHFSGQQISMYPKTGLIVAYYSTCWVWTAPIIPVPTFVYSAPVPKNKFVSKKMARAQALGAAKPSALSATAKETVEETKLTQPVPQMGSNPVDGVFIRQGFNWYFNPRWYVKSLLSYGELAKGGVGIRTNYSILGEQNEGELRWGSTNLEGNFGGLTHYLSFGEKLIKKEDEEVLIYDYYKPGGKYSYELEFNYSYRERVNLDENTGPFSRVTTLPKSTLRSNRKPLPMLGDPFTYYFEASTALVSEEVTEHASPTGIPYAISSQMTNFTSDISYKNDMPFLGLFNYKLEYASSDYADLGKWNRSRQIMSLTQDFFDRFTLNYGHVHYVTQSGFSPFLFENYYVSLNDTFVGSLKVKAWFSSLQIRTAYSLPSWEPFDIRYELLLGEHCYNLIFSYSVMKKEFNFSFELTPSRW
jgi:hypothetical protein